MKPALKSELLPMDTPLAEAVDSLVELPVGSEKPATRAVKQWRVAIHNDYKALEKPWRQLESSGRCTVFQGYDYASSWYDAALECDAAEPLIVLVSKEDGSIAWIFPLCLSHHKNLRIISFADLGLADYAAPLIAADAPADRDSVTAMTKAVFAALPSCDVVNFKKLARDVEGVPNPLLFLQGLKTFPEECHGIHLTRPWPELAPQIMQRRLRRTIRQEREKVEKKGAVAFEHCDTPESLEPAMNRLLVMRQERFKEIGLPEMPPVWENFYRILTARKDRKLYASITTMTVGGQPIAACFGLKRGKDFYALVSSFRMGEWERFRPGMQLFDFMLTKFAERNGNDGYFDFTIGDETYKKRLGCDSRPLYDWMEARSLKGLTYYAVWWFKYYVRSYPQVFAMLQKTVHYLRGANRRKD